MSTIRPYLYTFCAITILAEALQWPPKRRVSYVLTCLVAVAALLEIAWGTP